MDLVAESAITNASGEASNVSASASASTTSASASAAAAMLTRHIGRISRAQAARESLLEATSATASVSRSHTFASEGMAISTTASVTEATAFASHPSSNPLLQRPCCVDMSAAFVASNRDASLPLSHDRQSRHKEQPTSERNTSHIAPLQIDTAACEADGMQFKPAVLFVSWFGF